MALGKKTGGRQPGSKNKETVEIKNLIDSCVDFNEVIGKLYKMSIDDEKPDPSAAKLLLEYRFGKPKQEIELGGKTKFVVTIKK